MNNEEQPHPVDALFSPMGYLMGIRKLVESTDGHPPTVEAKLIECDCVNCPDDCDCGCVDCWPDCTCECHEEEWKEYRS